MTRQEHRREARSRRQPPVRLEFSLAEALALQTVALRDDDIVYNSTLHVHGVCRPSELLAVAEELGEGVRFRVALLPTARPHLGQVIALYPVGRKPLRHNGVDVPFVSIFRRAQFDGIYARLVATNQKPQRLFPVNHDGDLGFVGEAGAGYTADTLDETLSLGLYRCRYAGLKLPIHFRYALSSGPLHLQALFQRLSVRASGARWWARQEGQIRGAIPVRGRRGLATTAARNWLPRRFGAVIVIALRTVPPGRLATAPIFLGCGGLARGPGRVARKGVVFPAPHHRLVLPTVPILSPP